MNIKTSEPITPTTHGRAHMRTLIRGITLLAGMVYIPIAAAAQKKEAMHEFGVDLGIGYSHEGSLGGVSCSTDCGTVAISTPVDFRLGVPTSPTMTLEIRSAFNYIKNGSGHFLTFAPDLNFLKALGGSNQKGTYLTGGAGIFIASAASPSSSTTTATQVSVNGGVGTRVPFESAAWRLEAFLRYNFENSGKNIPSSYGVGARIGISFFH